MNRIFLDTIFLLSGSLFTLGAAQGGSIVDVSPSVHTDSASTPNMPTSTSTMVSTSDSTTTSKTTIAPNMPTSASTMVSTSDSTATSKTTIAPNMPTSASTMVSTSDSTATSKTTIAPNMPTSTSTMVSTSDSTTTSKTTIATSKTIPPVKKFVAAAVRSHFDDCPDSHSHFCFHGTCRFLILEETPACLCQAGFVGVRCEHADLLAVVATNHRQQTVATVLVLCVMGCVLTILFCTLLHCLWRRDYERRRRDLYYIPEKARYVLKGGTSFCPSESVV